MTWSIWCGREESSSCKRQYSQGANARSRVWRRSNSGTYCFSAMRLRGPLGEAAMRRGLDELHEVFEGEIRLDFLARLVARVPGAHGGDELLIVRRDRGRGAEGDDRLGRGLARQKACNLEFGLNDGLRRHVRAFHPAVIATA